MTFNSDYQVSTLEPGAMGMADNGQPKLQTIVTGPVAATVPMEQPVHQVRDWFSGAAAYFGWMREAKRENTRCGLRPMSDKAASQKTRSP